METQVALGEVPELRREAKLMRVDWLREMATTLTRLELLSFRSSSVSLTWGEDKRWELSVIRGGQRLVATGENVSEVVNALVKQI